MTSKRGQVFDRNATTRMRRGDLSALALAMTILSIAMMHGRADAQGAEVDPVPATAPAPVPAPAPAPHPGPEDPLDRGVPRGAMSGFLSACRTGAYEKASGYLDLRRTSEPGAVLARQLCVVITRKVPIDLDGLSEEPQGNVDDSLPSWRERVARIETSNGRVDILLQRVPREGDSIRIWKVASVTVDKIPDLYGEFGYGPLEDYLPPVLIERSVLGVALWQWIALAALVPISGLVSWIVAGPIVWLWRRLVVRERIRAGEEHLRHRTVAPLRLVIAVLLSRAAVAALGLDLVVFSIISTGLNVLFAVGLGWLAFRIADRIARRIELGMLERGQPNANALVAPSRKGVKAIILFLAFVTVLRILGFEVTALLAGLGVGGIAVALAAQKTIENLFGGITLFADHPIRVGDFCKFGDQVGTVEEIGIRSTRIRTLDRTVITIPNADFSSMQIENYATRDRMRLFAVIGLRYETTPDQLRYVLVEIRKLLYSHERVLPDPARARFIGFGAYSLDIEIFAYVNTPDWGEFLGIREDIYLRIMTIVEQSGSGFAFPSQTLYLGQDPGLPPERTREAMERVRGWREDRELFLPEFPAEKIAALRGSVRYPPEGSPGSEDCARRTSREQA